MEKLGELFNAENPLEASVDTAFSLEEVNEALDKVRQGKSKGKTILKIE
ncbi:zinc-binding dehydrogenase [Oribacterium sinus]|nr:zinc-binding dehydrogenase [Oribacterium sinus]